MHFNNSDEIQALLDKAASTKDRLEIVLFLLNAKCSDLTEVSEHLREIVKSLQAQSKE